MTAKRVVTGCKAIACAVASLIAMPASAGTLSTIYAFKSTADGGGSNVGLTLVGSNLYGVAPSGGSSTFFGTVFRISATTGGKATLYKFTGGTDGRDPKGALTYVGGTFYGTTQGDGGDSGYGTVFSFKTAGAVLTTLYSFPGPNNAGEYVSGALTYAAGSLFGTAPSGGPGSATSPGEGTVFAVTPAGAETTLHGFTADSGGLGPNGGLLYANGTLYGTTSGFFGPHVYPSSVFAIDATTGATTTLHSFSEASDGFDPASGVVKVGAYLWGTTLYGGASGCGTVYKINVATHVETIVHSFACAPDGNAPWSGLVNVSGTLYGSTVLGGAYGDGEIYSVNPATGLLTTVYSFTGGTDGARPYSQLINAGGTLYGTTTSGALGTGTVFKFVP